MRIAIAHIGQETCSFTPKCTTLETYRQYGLYEGQEVLARDKEGSVIGGFLAAMQEKKLEPILLPIVRGWAGASGMLTAETLAWFSKKLETGLRNVLPIDGFFFSQHGAAAAENEPDVEGYLLEVVRRVLGKQVPIIAPLDHHGNITERMMHSLTALVGHRTQPHNPFDTGKLAAQLLFATLQGKVKPCMAWRKIPLITHQEQFLTCHGPMKQWFDQARALEQHPDVLSISPFPMQPWLDVPEGGWSVVVVTDDDPVLAQQLADEMADSAWALRDQFLVTESIPANEAVRRAEAAKRGLVILSDTGDSVLGGAPGDSTAILRAMLAEGIHSPALVPMVDPQAVAAAIKAGVGKRVTLTLGAKQSSAFHQPLEVTGRVAAIGGGWLNTDMLGIGSFTMGRAVLLEVGPIRIVVSEREGIGGNHPVVYRHFGVEPGEAKMIVLKTASNFQGYADLTSQIIRVNTAGPTMSNLAAFQWKHLPRPIYPLD